MLTGQRAFEGATAGSLVGAILAKEPAPLATRQPVTPPALERLVKRCLAKDPDQRWDSAHDVADELRWISTAGGQVTASAPGASSAGVGRGWSRRRALLFGAALATLGIVTGLQTAANEGFPVFSPDGRWLAYASDVSGRWEVYVRPHPGEGPAQRVSIDGGSGPADWSLHVSISPRILPPGSC